MFSYFAQCIINHFATMSLHFVNLWTNLMLFKLILKCLVPLTGARQKRRIFINFPMMCLGQL